MPVLSTTAYVTLETVLNLIRAIANDQIFSQAGEILTDNASFTFSLLNDSLEHFTNEVNNHGIDTFRKETVLTPVTAIATVDAGLQVNVSDAGFFDSNIQHMLPQLPTDLLVPTFLWERQTGSTEPWIEMEERPDGLPATLQTSRLKIWEWRQDGIYMPGALQSNDVRLRYEGSHAMFATPQDSVLFRGATGPIAYKMVSTYLMSKNPDAAKMAAGEASMRVSQLATRNARMKQREPITRASYGNFQRGTRFTPPRNP